MPALLGPAIAPVLGGPAEVFVSAGSVRVATPPPPVIDDPDVPYVPVSAMLGPKVQVVLGRAITGTSGDDCYGELTTAVVDDWDEDVELLAGSTASITASSSDPLWSLMGLEWTLGTDGRRIYTVKPRELVVWIYEDDVCVWTGRFVAPIDIGGGMVKLPAQGPQSVFPQRILGHAEQVDLLDDRGSFERYASIAAMRSDGWVIPVGVEAELVADGVRGDQCLRVRGSGWVRSPKVTLDGADGYGRAVIGSVFGKWDITIPEGAVVIKTFAQRTDSDTPSNVLLSDEASGVRPDDAEGWTDNPVVSGARMSPEVVGHRCWNEFASFADVWSYYDLDTLRQSIQTGFPPGTERDLSVYVEKVLGDLHKTALGGSPTGLTFLMGSLTGTLASLRYSHAQRTPVSDILSSILDAEGGPECSISVDWMLSPFQRLGADRVDIALSPHDIIDPGWSNDPGAWVSDYVVDTGVGEGATWISATVSTPVLPDEWRQVAIVNGPVDRSLNENEAWALAHARASAREQVVADPIVRRDVARQINKGDVLWVLLEDGDLGEHRQMRVLRKRWLPKIGGHCQMSLGAVDA